MRKVRHSIKHIIMNWLYNNEVSISEIASVLDEYYGAYHKTADKPKQILDALSKNYIDEELALNWGISTLYERFRVNHDDETAKEKTVEVIEELLNHFKQYGGK